MRTTALIFAAAAAITAGALQGQNVVYQQAGTIGGAIAVTSGAMSAGRVVSSTVLGGRTITGSPFSATEQRHSLQVLGDGTHIEQTENTQISRDSEGRTRTETTPAGNDAPAMVTIQDPVAGANYFLDPAHKMANKLPLPKGFIGMNLPGSVTVPGPILASAGADAGQIVTLKATSRIGKAVAAPADEDLGVQNVNGVLAKGTRTTITIPVGEIGNDRALQVVNEHWYSDELGMIVKSSNSDPRFGANTYELTNIVRAAQDPSLFQIPADYAVSEGKAMYKAAELK